MRWATTNLIALSTTQRWRRLRWRSWRPDDHRHRSLHDDADPGSVEHQLNGLADTEIAALTTTQLIALTTTAD